jgi:hypothetical protein
VVFEERLHRFDDIDAAWTTGAGVQVRYFARGWNVCSEFGEIHRFDFLCD